MPSKGKKLAETYKHSSRSASPRPVSTTFQIGETAATAEKDRARSRISKKSGAEVHGSISGWWMIARFDGHQPIRLPIRQTSERDRIHNREHGGISAHPDRESTYRNQSEGRALSQKSNRIPEVIATSAERT